MMERIRGALRQYLPEMRAYFPHIAVVAVFAVLGALNGVFQAVSDPADPNIRETWSVPQWAPYQAGDKRVELAKLEIWDGKKVAAAKPAAPPQQPWRFVGTVRKGKAYAAVILTGEGRIQRAIEGDVLPGGEKILAVENGTLQIDANGTTQQLKTFHDEKKK